MRIALMLALVSGLVGACDDAAVAPAEPRTPVGPISCDGYPESDYDEGSARFEVEGDKAIMSGVIDTSTPAAVDALVANHPSVTLIIMPFVPGSDDDDANLVAARKVRAFGLATCVPAEGLVASGGTDFFIAGTRRAAGVGAKIGVHSWAGDGIEGSDLPMNDPEHDKYLSYYNAMGIDAAFYWFTLQAAGSDAIYDMTRAELQQYGLLTD